jgi:hypothetical protein
MDLIPRAAGKQTTCPPFPDNLCPLYDHWLLSFNIFLASPPTKEEVLQAFRGVDLESEKRVHTYTKNVGRCHTCAKAQETILDGGKK